MLLKDLGRVEFIGVWGRQAISRLKKILRERGAEFEVMHIGAQDLVVKSYSQHYSENYSASNAGLPLKR